MAGYPSSARTRPATRARTSSGPRETRSRRTHHATKAGMQRYDPSPLWIGPRSHNYLKTFQNFPSARHSFYSSLVSELCEFLYGDAALFGSERYDPESLSSFLEYGFFFYVDHPTSTSMLPRAADVLTAVRSFRRPNRGLERPRLQAGDFEDVRGAEVGLVDDPSAVDVGAVVDDVIGGEQFHVER